MALELGSRPKATQFVDALVCGCRLQKRTNGREEIDHTHLGYWFAFRPRT